MAGEDMSELRTKEVEEAVKKALREWLDEKYSQFGKWTLHGLAAAGLGGLVWLFMVSSGWHK